MKRYETLLVGFLGFAAVACASDCESATEKLDTECNDEIRRAHEGRSYSSLPLTGGSEECNEDEECVAECIEEADCASIAYVMATGGAQVDPNATPPPGTGPFLSCLRECHPGL